MHKGFVKSGHLPTFFSSFLTFDLARMVWLTSGPPCGVMAQHRQRKTGYMRRLVGLGGGRRHAGSAWRERHGTARLIRRT